MLSDKSLMKLSLAVSLAGVVALFVFLQFEEPKLIGFEEIESHIGNNVVVVGQITAYSESKGNIFATLNNSAKIVMFAVDAERRPDAYLLKTGDSVTVTGKVQLYRGSTEIIAKSIRKA